MRHLGRKLLCIALGGLVLSLGSTPSLAAKSPGHCSASGSTNAACQFEVPSYTQAPTPTGAGQTSKGIRLDSGVMDVLFNNYPTIGPRFISNNLSADIFVPQGTATEFQDFLNGAPTGVTINDAIVPGYAATPVQYAGCNLIPATKQITVPSVVNNSNASLPIIVNSYTLYPASPALPAIGSTAEGASPAQFTYTRPAGPLSCVYDNEGNQSCVTAQYTEDQLLSLVGVGAQHNYTWGLSTPLTATTAPLYVSINNGVSWAVTPDCNGNYSSSASGINGSCGTATTSGLALTVAPIAVPPSTVLCASGNATAVAGSGPWSWQCTGVNGGTTVSCSAGAAGCLSTNLSWTVSGLTCSGNIASASSGSTKAVTASGVYSGNATFTCTDGSWSAQPAPGATCTAVCTPSTCSVTNGTCIVGTAPSCTHTITCDSGYTLSNGSCVADTCNPSSVANGTVGAYPSCAITCDSGYTLSNGSCVANTCNPSTCSVTNGTCMVGTAPSCTHTITCDSGYTLSNGSCVADADTCNPSACSVAHGTCTVGAYPGCTQTITCNNGYTQSGNSCVVPTCSGGYAWNGSSCVGPCTVFRFECNYPWYDGNHTDNGTISSWTCSGTGLGTYTCQNCDANGGPYYPGHCP